MIEIRIKVADNSKVKNLEWKEFLRASRELEIDNQLCNIVEAEFKGAEYFIECMSYYYELQTEIPRINVDSSFGSKNSSPLYYDPQDKTINISHELISKYFKNKNPIELEDARNEFLWGIAHEFFHHGRNHIAIWNHYGITKRDTSSQYNHILRFLEDDVDRLATKALYRHFLFYVHKRLHPYELKLKVLDVLFNTIRIKIDNEKRIVTKHPAWATRLYSQIIELSEIDNTNNDPQFPKKRVTDKTYSEQKLLTETLNNMEREHSGDLNFDLRDYSEKGIDFPKDDQALNKVILNNPNQPITQRFLDLYYLNEPDKEIGQFLRANCQLPGLRNPTRNWVSRSEQNRLEFIKTAQSWLKITGVNFKVN